MKRKKKSATSPPPISDSKPFDYTLYKSRFLPRIPNAEASVKKETLQTVEGRLESSRKDQTMNNPKEESKLGKRKREDEKQEEKEPLEFQFGYMRIDGKLYHASATETGPMVFTPYHQHVKEQLEIAGPSGKAGMLKAMGIKDPEMMEKKRKRKRKASLKKKKRSANSLPAPTAYESDANPIADSKKRKRKKSISSSPQTPSNASSSEGYDSLPSSKGRRKKKKPAVHDTPEEQTQEVTSGKQKRDEEDRNWERRMKKRRKNRERLYRKSQREWAERLEEEARKKAEREKKRRDNIREYIRKKKLRKLEKLEKKSYYKELRRKKAHHLDVTIVRGRGDANNREYLVEHKEGEREWIMAEWDWLDKQLIRDFERAQYPPGFLYSAGLSSGRRR